jgi:hypothetical protein
MLAAVLLAACPGGTPDPEQMTVGGRSVFLIQEAHCFLGDCVASFFVNRVNYTPSCGSLPAWLRNEARVGETYAVADPDSAPPLPYERDVAARDLATLGARRAHAGLLPTGTAMGQRLRPIRARV